MIGSNMFVSEIQSCINSFSLNLFYITTLFSSAFYFLYLRSIWKQRVPEIFFWLHFFIVSWSALMYCNLLFDTPLKPFAWYCDWIISTPLIMLAIALTAMYPLKHLNISLIFAIMSTQVIIILTGYLAQIAPTSIGLISFFIIGNVFMLLIFYLIYGPLMQIAKTNKLLYTKYRALAMLLMIFWISYPTIWIIGTPGFGLFSDFTTNVFFVILPILCKPVFGIIDLFLLKSIPQE